MPNLPKDLIEITSYNSKHGNIDLKGLMYSPSEKALYNKGFLNKKINLNNKRNFYTYAKSEDPNERKRICINIGRFIRQYPEYKNIQEISETSSAEALSSSDFSFELSIDFSSIDFSSYLSSDISCIFLYSGY